MSSAYLQDGGYKAKLKRFEPGGPLFVRITTVHGSEWVSTGQTTFEAAREVTRRADVMAIERERAAALLARDIQRRTSTAKTCLRIVDEWRAYLEPIISPDHLRDKVLYLRACLRELGIEDKLPGEVGHDGLSRWVNTKGIMARQNKVKAIRSFFGYARSMGYCPNNPAELVRIRLREMTIAERTQKKTELISEEEYRRLIASEKLPAFWRSVVVIAYWTGLRLRDIVCLEWASIQEDRIFTYQRKTGDKVEHRFADPAIAGGELQAVLKALPRNDTPYVFPEERRLAINPDKRAQLSNVFRLILLDHGIRGKKFHSFRHVCAVRVNNQGGDARQMLGHRSRWSTAKYLDHAPDMAEDCL